VGLLDPEGPVRALVYRVDLQDARMSPASADVVDSLRGLGPCTVRELTEDTGRTRAAAQLAVGTLLRRGLVDYASPYCVHGSIYAARYQLTVEQIECRGIAEENDVGRMSMARWDVLDSLRTLGRATAAQIAEDTGRRRPDVVAILALAEDADLVVRDGVEDPHAVPVWRIAASAVIPEEPPHATELDRRPRLTYDRLLAREVDWSRAYPGQAEAYAGARRYARRAGRPWPPERP